YTTLHSSVFFLHCVCVIVVLFFFSSRRRHTRSKRDWSSDVCSSDLRGAAGVVTDGAIRDYDAVAEVGLTAFSAGAHPSVLGRRQIGRASCRERVEISVVAVALKKKKRGRSGGSGVVG